MDFNKKGIVLYNDKNIYGEGHLFCIILVDNLCRKTKIHKATSNLKISYFPLELDPKETIIYLG